MAVIVTVYPEKEVGARLFEIRGHDIASQLVNHLEDEASGKINLTAIHPSGDNEVTIAVIGEPDRPKWWYIKVIDVIKDTLGDEHEVLSRLSIQP